MTHRPARVARLLTVSVLLGVFGGSSWTSPVAACSCGLTTTRNLVDRALAIVSGEPVDRWSESCGPPTELEASILLLGWRASNGRFDVSSGCAGHTLDPTLLDRLFGPPELFPDGEPVAVVSADAGGHAAKLVDAEGRAVRYLPGRGETHGLAPCPGGEHFVQLRGGPGDGNSLLRSFELAIWRYDGWSQVAVYPVESPEAIETSETLVCLRPDGGDVLIVWSAYVGATGVGDGKVTPVEFPVGIPGPDGAAFEFQHDRPPQVRNGDEAFDVTWELGDGFTRSIHGDNLMSMSPDPEGWDLTVDDWLDDPGEASRFGVRVVRLGVDGRATTSSDVVPIDSLGWQHGMLIPSERRTTRGVPAQVPPPLFERSGHALASPPAVSAVETSAVETSAVETAAVGTSAVRTSAVPTPSVSESSTPDPDPGDDVDDGTPARWIAAGFLALVVASGILLVVRRSDARSDARSDGRRDESPPVGGDS